MYLITKDFFKKINDKNLKQKVLDKCCTFSEILLKEEQQIRNLPKGFWVKKISNTEIFKFRLNSGDRILFTYVDNKDDNKRAVLFLELCNHDEQIRRGQSITKKLEDLEMLELDIDRKYEKDDEIDEKYLKNYIEYDYLNLENAVAMLVEKDYIAKMCEEDNEDYIYYLTQKQFEVVKDNSQAVLVTGAAGSGKTTVAVHKIKSLEGLKKIAYITNTQLLCENVEKMYQKFYSSENVQFLFLNKLYSEILKVNLDNLAKFEDFKKIAEPIKNMHYKGLKNIDIMDIYIEYRGILKGYLGLEGSEIENIFTRKNNMLSLESYLNIPKSYSIFSEKEKKSIYDLCSKYYFKLKEKNLIEPLDLPLRVIEKINNKEIDLFEYIIVDEIQDLNEIEIYMLSQLVENKNKIMFSGDIHQTVNPTFFDIGRLKNIYYGQGGELSLHILDKNYRNSLHIIELLNKLAEDRQKYIGKTKYDYVESGVIEGGNISLGSLKKKDLKQVLEAICEKHYCAIIVANEAQKDKLVSISKKAESRIFTVNEIKGLEYENIYCFNIISANGGKWNEIYQSNSKSNSKYRYYFNSLYVALSRAKKNLYIFEDRMDNCVVNSFKKVEFVKYEKVISFDNARLGLDKESNKNDWLKESERLEKVGQASKSKFARNRAEEERIIGLNSSIDNSDVIVAAPGLDMSNLKLIDIVESKDEFSELMNEGFKYYQLRKYGKALEYYEKALAIDDQNPELYHCMANAFGYMNNGREISLGYFDESIRLDPTNFTVSLDKAAILSDRGRTEEVIETLEEALKYNKDVINIYQQLVDECMVLYEKNYDRNIDNDECLNKIIKYSKLGLKAKRSVKWDCVNKIWTKDIFKEKEKIAKSNLSKIYSIAKEAKHDSYVNSIFIKIIKVNNANKRQFFI